MDLPIGNYKIIGIDLAKNADLTGMFINEYPCPVDPTIHCTYSEYNSQDGIITISCHKKCSKKNNILEENKNV